MSIVIEQLVLQRGAQTVLSNLNLEIGRGEWVGLIGSNGSGKSTLLSALAGLLPIASGRIVVDGHPAGSFEARRLLGKAIDPAQLPLGLTGQQLLELVAEARQLGLGLPRDTMALAESFRLTPALPKLIVTYSLGMKQKLGILAGLIDAPPYWLLDESLNGLDPPSAFVLKQYLQAAQTRGITTLLATHSLDLAERHFSRVLILADGQLLADWTSDHLAALRAHPEQSVEAALVAACMAVPSHAARATQAEAKQD